MDVERFRRNSGQGEMVDINGDKFYFKPMPLDMLPEFMSFDSLQNKDVMSKEEQKTFFDIIKRYIQYCFPELKDNPELCDGFIRENTMIIMEKMMILSMPKVGGEVSEQVKSQIAKIKSNVKQQ
jgi:hypothetical protein